MESVREKRGKSTVLKLIKERRKKGNSIKEEKLLKSK